MIVSVCFAMLSIGFGSRLACQARDGLVSAADQQQVKACRSGVLLGWLFILCGPVVSFGLRGF